MQTVKNLFLSLLFFIVFSVLGNAVGFGIGYIVTILNNEGLFISWKQLDSHLEFEKIADVTSQTVWARASDGKLYSWDSNCDRETKCNRWVETKGIPNIIYGGPEQPMIKNDSCQIRKFRFIGKLPGNLLECAQGSFLGFDSETTVYYALLDDGTIWTWRFSRSMIVDIFLTILFSFGGLVLGILVFFVFMIRRSGENKTKAIIKSNQ